jgi:hypothetical protein
MSLPAWASLGPNATAPLVGHACEVRLVEHEYPNMVCECGWAGPHRLTTSALLGDVEHHLATARWGA